MDMSNNGLMTNGQIKILIADNDEAVLTNLEQLLEDLGYTTTTAVSCQEVATMLSQKSFDLMVLDDLFSDGDSARVLTECGGSEPSPLVVVTYYHSPTQDTELHLRSLGVSAFVNKRAHPELAEIVRYLLEPRPRLRDHVFDGIT
jgi:CheY-like chemotaxis protein